MNNKNALNLKLMKTHVRSIETLIRKLDYEGEFPTLYSERIKNFKIELAKLEHGVNMIKDRMIP